MCLCLCSMNTFLIGNSLVRNVVHDAWSTVCLPGAGWVDIILYILRDGHRFRNSFVYILVGPVRFTELHRMHGRRECVLSDFNVGTPKSVFRPYTRRLRSLNVIPILCTIYPMDFQVYNLNFTRPRLEFEDSYQQWTDKIKGMAVVENRLVVNFNVSRGMATPFIHRRIFHRRNRRYAFKLRYLSDGLHPVNSIVRDWIREIRRVDSLNRQAWRQRQ